MKRRAFLTGLAAGLASATPVMAESMVDSIVRQLTTLGFDGITQERTLLGRVRIVAYRKDGQREIILNPKTGEILRDLWTPIAGGTPEITIIDDHKGKTDDSYGGKGGDDHDDDHDDGHDGGDDGGGKGGDHGSGGGDSSGKGGGGD